MLQIRRATLPGQLAALGSITKSRPPGARLTARLPPRAQEEDRGTRWEYGTNIDFVGKAVEAVSGKKLDTYLRDNIFLD